MHVHLVCTQGSQLLVPLAQRDSASRGETPRNRVASVELGTLRDHVPVFLVFQRTLAAAAEELVTSRRHADAQCRLLPM